MAGVHRRLEAERHREPVSLPAREPLPDPTGLMSLQRAAGNAAVARLLARVRSRTTGETYTDTSAELFAPALDDYGAFSGKQFRREEERTRKTLAQQRDVKEKTIPPGDVRIGRASCRERV